MSWAVAWGVIAAVFVLVEMFTMEFTCLSLALGAGLAAGVAGLGLGAPPQFIAALIGTVLSLFLLRPFMRSRFTPADTATAGDLIVGSEADVIEAIGTNTPGKVKLDGVIWNAESDQAVPVGTRVVITDLQGTMLRVLSRAALLPRTADLPTAEATPRALPVDDTLRS